ncbi:hypothetical protein [Paraburkholderia franconis]|uniref:hypothetical protein n=1 Tax=Paraburkholderia franconis TaxID=2654983 RepID=UPI00187B9115|nr:hypothetical protein [Paraburkholderia franconis]
MAVQTESDYPMAGERTLAGQLLLLIHFKRSLFERLIPRRNLPHAVSENLVQCGREPTTDK